MKKILSVLFALALLFTAACAETSLTPVNTMVQIYPFFDSYVAMYFAEVVNTGDTLIQLDSNRSKAQLMDAEGNVLLEETIFHTSPYVLAPGETGYVTPFYMYLDDVNIDALTDYAIHLYAEEAFYLDPTVYLAEDCISAELLTQTTDWGDEETFLHITFTNQTDETIFDFSFAIAIYDQNGALMYTGEESMYDVGVPAGQSVIIRTGLDEMFTQSWAQGGLTPSRISVIGYMN